MFKSYLDEEWREVPFQPGALRKKYAVSNYGRVASYKENLQDGNLLKTSKVGGYPVFISRPFGKTRTFYVHKLAGEAFLPSGKGKDYLIHLDYNKSNNHLSNLKWVTKEEMIRHHKKNPYVQESRERRKQVKTQKGHKLTSTDVIRIKKKIFDPNRKTRMKIIAKQFGISEMQLYRIKSGENWGHIRLEDSDLYDQPESNGDQE